MIAGALLVVICAAGVFYLRKRRKQNHTLDSVK
jgi:hypothetical protein